MDGKVAMVTGASSGIGRAIACRLAAENARVVVTDIRSLPREGSLENDAGLSTASLIEAAGGEAIFVRADVTKWVDMASAARTAVANFGDLDVMINNAGIWHGHRTILEETEAEFDLDDGDEHQGGVAGVQGCDRAHGQGRGPEEA